MTKLQGIKQGWRAGLAVSISLAACVATAAPVDGLIVKLRDAPAHERMAAMSAGSRAAHGERLARVLQAERMTEARARPVGRDAQHLQFGRRLSQDEARAMAERLRGRPDVEWVELNTRERLLQSASNVPNDLYYRYQAPGDLGQWWLRPDGETAGEQLPSYGAPGMQEAWALTRGSASAVVAVLDTGITAHEDLPTSRVLPGYDFVSEVEYANDGNGRDANPADPGDWVTEAESSDGQSPFDGCTVQDSSWHGTIISGMVAAATNNTIGVAGINWNGRVLPVRVAGKCGATVTDITDGMRWAAGLSVAGVPDNPNPARILNISFGGDAACGSLYQSTINELAAIGVVVVAAAGNESGPVTRPASCNGVVAVGALARDGLKASYSNIGTQVTVSTVGGDPGVDDGLLTVLNSGTQAPAADIYGNVYGTSFATPIVAGVVSLMLSVNPQLTVQQILTGLRSTARPHVQSNSGVAACSANNPQICVCTTSTCGAGVLDAEGAVRYAQSPAPTRGDDGGGGALGTVWLGGLALAVWTLALLRQRARLRAARRA